MAELEIRSVSAEEWPAFGRTTDRTFGHQPTEAELDRYGRTFEPDRSIAVFDQGAIVGTASAISFELTLPGLTSVPVAGVSYVGVLPTHRRRGILTSMMRHQLDDVYQRGEALAVLTASESVIYGRFGYGLASVSHEVELTTAKTAFLARPADEGRLTMIDTLEAGKVLPPLHERCRRSRPGDISRIGPMWDLLLSDPEDWRRGASALFYVVHESSSGEPDGFVTYRTKDRHGEIGGNELWLEDLRAVTPEVEAALWRYVLDVDLIGVLKAENRPVDDALPWLLADPRQYRTVGRWDFLWCRVVDVVAALESRCYSVEDELVIEVADSFCPWNSGRYRLTAGIDGVECRRERDRQPDVAVNAVDLGAAYLGGVRFSTLASAGRAVELTPRGLTRADALFTTEPAPWCTTAF